MRLRLVIALLTVIALPAFAPAPFPKGQRRGQQDEITLRTFQGRWRVTDMRSSHATGRHEPYSWSTTHIRITENRWEFMTNNQTGNVFFIAIDPGKKPAHLNFHNRSGEATVSGVGLIRRQGGKVQIIYNWTSDSNRPSFDPPTEGGWIVTLERE